LPLPPQFTADDLDALLLLIPAVKDVDGLRGDWQSQQYTNYSTVQLQEIRQFALPPMVLSVVSLLNSYDISLDDKQVVVVGKGRLVGKPLTLFFEKVGVTISAVDEHTENILDQTTEADVLITGTGQANLVTYQWIKPEAIVIDCARDVHHDSVDQIAKAISPAIGGIGPLTVFWLLFNVYQAASNQS
jgi:methylenetetrahydrofolate dehydrogenase (NADP+)/methenyltetrahydrofolate cyclohydrolase